jgi:hypothetical protein
MEGPELVRRAEAFLVAYKALCAEHGATIDFSDHTELALFIDGVAVVYHPETDDPFWPNRETWTAWLDRTFPPATELVAR